MRTDTIFYQLFQTFSGLLFELIGQPVEKAAGYQFTSLEIKEKAFRLDGIFIAEAEAIDKPIYFVEIQFQKNLGVYWEFIAEINIYLNQYRPPQAWQAIAIFPKRNLDIEALTAYQREMVKRS